MTFERLNFIFGLKDKLKREYHIQTPFSSNNFDLSSYFKLKCLGVFEGMESQEMRKLFWLSFYKLFPQCSGA